MDMANLIPLLMRCALALSVKEALPVIHHLLCVIFVNSHQRAQLFAKQSICKNKSNQIETCYVKIIKSYLAKILGVF